MSFFKNKRAAHVYVIEAAGNTTKIGVSTDPENRLLSLQTANPSKISLYFTLPCASARLAYKIENKAHAILADRRQNGEWFLCSSSEAVIAVAQATLAVASDDFGFVTIENEEIAISRLAARYIKTIAIKSGSKKQDIISEALENYYYAEVTPQLSAKSTAKMRGKMLLAAETKKKRSREAVFRTTAEKIRNAAQKKITLSALSRKAGISKLPSSQLEIILSEMHQAGSIIMEKKGRGATIRMPDSQVAA